MKSVSNARVAFSDGWRIRTLRNCSMQEYQRRGQPYLVLEYVEGGNIDRYCDQEGPSS